MTDPSAATPPVLDLHNCDREPIHIPNAIQPHGVLFAVEGPELEVAWVSANTHEVLGVPADALLGTELATWLDARERERFLEVMRSPEVHHHNPLALHVGPEARRFDAIAHRHGGQLIVELEPALAQDAGALDAYQLAREAISKLRRSEDLSELCANAAREVRRLTGFDRALVYVFDSAWNGRVVAEDKRPEVTSYLGLHFPASDIPRQARELYRLNPLRIIPTADYTPAALRTRGGGQPPLDLSFATLRNVSPMHIEYMKNMGVTASMSISLLRGQELWGLISCTHESGSRFVPYALRTACELLGEITSSLLDAKEVDEDSEDRARLRNVQTALLQSMSAQPDFVRGLLDRSPNLLDVTHAEGAAVYLNQRLYVLGKVPEEPQLMRLLEWLASQPAQRLFVTDSLPALYPAAESYRHVACGLMASPLSRGQHSYVLWFRPEVLQSVNWSGNPHKRAESVGGELRLHPRKSFELWKETVRLRSLPWTPAERTAATELMAGMVDLVLQKSEALAKLNAELERSNMELDSFAYAASHDLKEPLRGIHNYIGLVMRELGDEHMVGESRARMQTVIQLTQRMEDLINSLLHYAHVGRADLSLRDVDVNEVVAHTQEMLSARLAETGTVIRVARTLPSVRGDRVLLGEVFSNLITNALKYSDTPGERWVEIDCRPDSEVPGRLVFSVRDNGIGIRERNLETVFKIFRRLHARNKYGGGTGTGLTIAKRIIERHGGRIWVESTFERGSTFYFSLMEASHHGE